MAESIRKIGWGEQENIAIRLNLFTPVKIGKEYFMTRGHFHQKDTGEIYYCLYGSGIVLIQSKDGRTDYKELKPENLCYVPPGRGHRTINTGRKRFIFFFAYPSDAGHDYGIVKEKGFAKIVLEEKGKPRIVESASKASATLTWYM